ncbi:Mannan endo-1 4-beta-mannosidase 6 [Bienertia sinuspersici]
MDNGGEEREQFLVNGRPFYFNGFNTYWLMVFASEQSTRAKVSEVFQQASFVGLSVCRTWAFNDGQYQALQKSPSVYDENVFKGLDFVVSEAKKYDIRLILSLVNNWNDYGGKAQYVKWGKDAGLNLSSDDDFFSDSTLKTYYKNHIKMGLNRVNTITNVTYKDDPTIFVVVIN